MLEDNELDKQPQADKVSESNDDKQLIMEILAKMEELTDEVNNLRQQINDSSYQTNSLQNQADSNDDTIKALQEPSTQEKTSKSKKKNKGLTVVSNIIFYTLIFALVFGAFIIRSSKDGSPWMLGDYSAMTVLTGSMEDVYPKGSLIITKSVDPQKLKIGDDITYMTGKNTSITHRIIGITENYLGTNERGFETQGVMNDKPDKEIVSAGNVVGRVVFCSKTLGDIVAFITKNWPLLLFLIFVIVVLIAFLKWNSKREKHSPKDKTPPNDIDAHLDKITKNKVRGDMDNN